MKTHVLSISYGRRMFDLGNEERERLRLCATEVGSLHMIVFSRRAHTLQTDRVSENFVLYPTNSFFGISMIVDAIWIGLRIIRTSTPGTGWCITTQDPLGAGIVGYILRWITRYPLVVQEHGDIFSHDYWTREQPLNRLWYRVGAYLLRKADRVRVVSSRVATHIESLGVPKDRIRTLPVYTDIDAWQKKTPSIDLRTLHPNASCIVLAVARFVPQKNLPMLVRAFAHVQKTEPKAHLVLVGSGDEQEHIERLIGELGLTNAVSIMSWTDDVCSLMKSADVYALSSNYEGWGRVLIEAMAVGLPAVTTDVGCVGEVFKHDVHGLVVPIGDIFAFGQAMIGLVRDPSLRQRYSEAGARDSASMMIDIKTYARAWARIYDIDAAQ